MILMPQCYKHRRKCQFFRILKTLTQILVNNGGTELSELDSASNEQKSKSEREQIEFNFPECNCENNARNCFF